MRFNLWTLMLCLLLPASATAESAYTGTGFFVSHQGHIVTNAHVLNSCQQVLVRRQRGEFEEVEILGIDASADLAVLKSPSVAPRVAYLRDDSTPPRANQLVTVLGFPGDHATTGTLHYAESRIEAVTGANGESGWLQFKDSAAKGNSGGPLPDEGGNVVGVVTAKATFTRYNPLSARDEVVGNADMAIALAPLRAFLMRYGVPLQSRPAGLVETPHAIINAGATFIVSVVCRQ